MKKRLALTAAALAACLSLSVMADETSAPVPIHHTTAKHHPAKSTPKPATAKQAKAIPTASVAH